MDKTPRFASQLSDADARRLQRVSSRRGRASPAKVPARLARTSAFAPKRRGLITDAKFRRLMEDFRKGTLREASGRMGNLLNDVEWSGLGLDDAVRIMYGDWTANMIVTAKLVSLNADVQFALKSDYAKTFWPYIDSFGSHTWIDEERLAVLAGRDLWSCDETRFTRSEFRKAFDDMVRVGGLKSWRDETRGDGRKKSRRYHYAHGLDNVQLELPIGQSEPVALARDGGRAAAA